MTREDVEDRKEQLREGYDRVQQSVTRAAGDLSTQVRENPGLAVLAALAAGFLIGLILRSRRSDEDES